MKKITNMKKIAILTSLLFSAGFTNIAMADEAVKEKPAAVKDKDSSAVETVQINTGLRGLINSQKDAQILLSDPSLNIDATLGDITKYSALTAVQEAKNKLEETASKGLDQQTQLLAAEGAADTTKPATSIGGKDTANGKDQKEEDVAPVADIKATAVYTLGNTGYAEIIYNGSKNVVRKGDKLPNGEIVESLTPLSVVIKDGDTKRTLPIVSSASASNSGQQQGRMGGQNGQQSSDYTLTAPRMQ